MQGPIKHLSIFALLVGSIIAPRTALGQHAFGIMGDYLVNINNTENANLGLRLSYDRALGEKWCVRGMVGGMGGGQVVLRTAVPNSANPGLPIDTAKVDEREQYVHLTLGARRYILGGTFATGGVYLHAGLQVGFYDFEATPKDYDEARYTIPTLGETKKQTTLVLFPIGIGYEFRADKLVPFGEVAYMPGTSVGDGAGSMSGMGVTIGLRFPFGE